MFFTVTSGGEHPFVAMSKRPYSVARGEISSVALSLRETDRTEINSEFCAHDEANKFEAAYKMPYTKSNCETVLSSEAAFPDCSILALYGMEPDAAKRPCKPKEVFGFNNSGMFHQPLADEGGVVETKAEMGAGGMVVVTPIVNFDLTNGLRWGCHHKNVEIREQIQCSQLKRPPILQPYFSRQSGMADYPGKFD